MRIDGTYGLETHGHEEKGPKAEAPKGQPVAPGAEASQTVSSLQPLIAKAVAAEDVNVQAVEEARALLKSGQLDSPETARRAAQAIVDLGL